MPVNLLCEELETLSHSTSCKRGCEHNPCRHLRSFILAEENLKLHKLRSFAERWLCCFLHALDSRGEIEAMLYQ